MSRKKDTGDSIPITLPDGRVIGARTREEGDTRQEIPAGDFLKELKKRMVPAKLIEVGDGKSR